MDPTDVILIIVTGFAVGWINNLAGAAGALGLMAFEHFAGLDDVSANASLRLSALAIGVAGLLGFLSKKQKIPPKLWGYSALTIPGAVLGSIFVVTLPVIVFQLSLCILLLLVLGQQLGNKGGEGATKATDDTPAPVWLLFVLFTWLGMHMGYIQVATGLISIFILSMVHSRDLVEVNAAKMVFVIVSALTSNISLAFSGEIHWGPAGALAAGAAIGSFLASRWTVRKGHGAVRVVVIAICLVVLVRFGFKILG